MRDRLIKTISSGQAAFGLALSAESVSNLGDYYDLVQEHNPVLHLVGPCSPEEFATRHILESLVLLEYLPESANFVDVGAGAGLPSIPCLIVRSDLKATLIESKEKKAKFLQTAINKLSIGERANVIDRQFEEATPGNAELVTCRALDKFTDKLPRLIKWSKGRGLLFFGGPALGSEMRKQGLDVTEKLMPFSNQRFLFSAK